MTTIAVVEDDSNVLAQVKDVLQAEGFDVLLYHNDIPALEALETRSFDIVIADVRMPEVDGIELLRRLRQKIERANIDSRSPHA